ncbi:MAG: YraN family protein [Rhodospirillales bacterium]|nr:YraN family protein [Rhodospirillales bacterium]
MRGRSLEERRAAYARGLAAERLCALRLRLAGWRILARRYATPAGELDIVARRGGLIAFIEVKHRKEPRGALEAITAHQRRRIENAATIFLSRHPKWRKLSLRFDLMVVSPWRWPSHLPDAWRPDRSGTII